MEGAPFGWREILPAGGVSFGYSAAGAGQIGIYFAVRRMVYMSAHLSREDV